MKTLHFDCFCGASGDMLVGSLIDLGVKLSAIEWELGKLALPDTFHLHANRDERHNIHGIKFTVHDKSQHQCCGHDHSHDSCDHSHGHSHEHCHEHHHHDHAHSHSHAHSHEHEHSHDHAHTEADDGSEFIHEQGHAHSHEHEHGHVHGRNFAEITKLITDSALSDFVKERSLAVFRRIAVAEGKIHGVAPEQVAFHEVGAIDSIVDIISFCVGIEKLGKPRVQVSPLVEGTGWVQCAHGRMPVPAPATLEILAGIPLTQTDEPHELLTPTGAALLAEFAESYAPLAAFSVEKIGYGLGTRQLKSRPNLIRAVLGDAATCGVPAEDQEHDVIFVLETNLDDLSGEQIGAAQEKLFAAGALDVFYEPIQMKKNRPGVLLSVLCDGDKEAALTELILTHTTAFGVRRTTALRTKLRREIKSVATPFGSVEVKLGYRGDRLVQVAPEYESARKIADAKNVPLQQIYDAARLAAQPYPPPPCPPHSSSMKPTIAFVGVGRMGANMARRLKDQGYTVTALFDVHTPAATQLASELGCRAEAKLAAVTAAADLIITVVTDDAAMRAIFTAPGDNLLLSASGKTFISCATVAPVVHVEVETLAATVGAASLEACMASSITQAREGSLYLMCGGKREVFDGVKPVLQALGSSVRYLGPAGVAAQVKALVNMVMNINTAGLAEGLGLGCALGLDVALLREVFAQTGAASRVLQTDGEDMQNRDHSCFFSAAHAAKDCGIALALAKDSGICLPLAAAAKAQYDAMVRGGLGELDKSGVAELTFPGRASVTLDPVTLRHKCSSCV